MRLISNDPIHSLLSMNISRNHFGLAKTLLSFGEKLKINEQKLNFLKRCSSEKIFPRFIENNVHINCEILFPGSTAPQSIVDRLASIKSSILKQTITQSYFDISQYKYQIVSSKEELREIISKPMYNDILKLFEQNNESVKLSQKEHFQKKYVWLITRYHPPPTQDLPVEESPVTVVESAEVRVTTVGVEIEDCETELLGLGPNYALSPRIDEKLLEGVKLNIAETAYKLRWIRHLSHMLCAAYMCVMHVCHVCVSCMCRLVCVAYMCVMYVSACVCSIHITHESLVL